MNLAADDEAGQSVEDEGQEGTIHTVRMKSAQDCPVRRASRAAESLRGISQRVKRQCLQMT